jgi:6-phosphogluconolactonase
MGLIVEILPDKAALLARAKTRVVEQVTDAIATRGRCTLALAGGSTPKPLYEALAAADLPWQQLYIFWGDERYVPLTHPDSNAGMACAAWLDQVPIPKNQIFPVPTVDADPAMAAQAYENTLRQVFPEDAIPVFDLILLGLGDDAHTASLFPQTSVLNERQHWVGVGQKQDDPRITLTVPLINQARLVLFLVSGASKQAALTQVFAETADAQTYPARLIQPQGELRWLLDADAGAGIPSHVPLTQVAES